MLQRLAKGEKIPGKIVVDMKLKESVIFTPAEWEPHKLKTINETLSYPDRTPL